jgi:transposase
MATAINRVNFPQACDLQRAVDEADFIIGLDIHKKTTAATVIDPKHPEQSVKHRPRLKNTDLPGFIASFPGKKVVTAEASYGWKPLRSALAPCADTTLILLDPRKTSAWIATSGIKNDRIDAGVLAYACLQSAGRLAVYQPAPESCERYKLVTLRDRFVQNRIAVKNQLHALDRDYGINPYTGEQADTSDIVQFMRASLETYLQFLNQNISDIETAMASATAGDATAELLTTIPGIGPLTAYALRWKIDTIDRFEDAAHLTSYFGFGVRQWSSGDHEIRGKLTKTGDGLVRKLLVQGAQVMRYKHPEYVSLCFPRLGTPALMRNRVHANKVVAALARKHLTFAYHVWKKQTPFNLAVYRERRAQASQTICVSATPKKPSRAAELVSVLSA